MGENLQAVHQAWSRLFPIAFLRRWSRVDLYPTRIPRVYFDEIEWLSFGADVTDADMLPAHLQGLITGASERRVLRRELDKRLLPQRNYSQTLSIKISEPTLKHMVSKYSEQLVFQPVNEIRHWFTYQSGAYIEPGYPPLYYGRERNKALSPNKSAVAAVGEAIAGFLSQRLYRCRKLARPNHDCPDIVMEANGVTFLVESKATLKTEELIRERIDDQIPGMARLVISAGLLDRRPVMGLLVGTLLRSETDYYVCITEVAHEI